MNIDQTTVTAAPAKRFFVEMLTRDIELRDSLLDLVDNALDGVLRSGPDLSAHKPYAGKYIDLIIEPDVFTARDNCGGIPWDRAKDYAFRMGRPSKERDTTKSTVGLYGIGLKRAAFKVGRNIVVRTQTATHCYDVRIGPSWLATDHDWDLPASDHPRFLPDDGTEIEIRDFTPEAKARMVDGGADFINDLKNTISTHYSLILQRGFEIKINGDSIPAMPLNLAVSATPENEGAIAPYLYRSNYDGVAIFIAVGFHEGIPSPDDDEDQQITRYKSDQAGWTVICNERVVLYKDKTIRTGWGEADVPDYHNQFRAIAGVVEFTSTDTTKLPLTTTKRGVDSGHQIYLHAKNYMREGLKRFTNFTNQWKHDLPAHRQQMKSTEAMEFTKLKAVSTKLSSWKELRGPRSESKFEPRLPKPNSSRPQKVIRFSRPTDDINAVSKYLFDEEERKPSDVGAQCFDEIRRTIKR